MLLLLCLLSFACYCGVLLCGLFYCLSVLVALGVLVFYGLWVCFSVVWLNGVVF